MPRFLHFAPAPLVQAELLPGKRQQQQAQQQVEEVGINAVNLLQGFDAVQRR